MHHNEILLTSLTNHLNVCLRKPLILFTDDFHGSIADNSCQREDALDVALLLLLIQEVLFTCGDDLATQQSIVFATYSSQHVNKLSFFFID